MMDQCSMRIETPPAVSARRKILWLNSLACLWFAILQITAFLSGFLGISVTSLLSSCSTKPGLNYWRSWSVFAAVRKPKGRHNG